MLTVCTSARVPRNENVINCLAESRTYLIVVHQSVSSLLVIENVLYLAEPAEFPLHSLHNDVGSDAGTQVPLGREAAAPHAFGGRRAREAKAKPLSIKLFAIERPEEDKSVL